MASVFNLFFVFFFVICCSIFIDISNGYFTSYNDLETRKNCFCELEGSINDCKCEVDTVDHFNNIKIYPRLQSLLVKNYFRFYKVNLKRKCPFWPIDSKCAERFCQVENCEDKIIPEGLKEHEERIVPSFKLEGSINDCKCEVDTVDHFNNIKIYPRLQSLLVKNYFRFYKVNLKRKCPFWPIDSKCAERFCQVENCEDKIIPERLKEHEERIVPSFKYTENAQFGGCPDEEDFLRALSFLDTSISDQAHKEFQRWAEHDAAEEDFCIIEDIQNDTQYVDLLLNPERYTGYKGDSAHRIWKTIYLENCFGIGNSTNSLSNYVLQFDLGKVCLEQRAFYRLISGLHTSINIHLCSKYLLSESKEFLSLNGVWGHSVKEFKRRFSPESTGGEGPHWLRNLYFIYLVELRALAKAAPYLKKEEYYTGIAEEDEEVKLAINDLLSVIQSFQSHFDETALFSKGMATKFKTEYKEKFRNISRIMDCVGCDKCKLWGKLQTQGLGTALKILYSEKLNQATERGQWENSRVEFDAIFRLTRTEIVALFNAFGRLSNSIYEMENFRKLLR